MERLNIVKITGQPLFAAEVNKISKGVDDLQEAIESLEIGGSETGPTIKIKLELLEDEGRLDASAIKNLPEGVTNEEKIPGTESKIYWNLHQQTKITPIAKMKLPIWLMICLILISN